MRLLEGREDQIKALEADLQNARGDRKMDILERLDKLNKQDEIDKEKLRGDAAEQKLAM